MPPINVSVGMVRLMAGRKRTYASKPLRGKETMHAMETRDIDSSPHTHFYNNTPWTKSLTSAFPFSPSGPREQVNDNSGNSPNPNKQNNPSITPPKNNCLLCVPGPKTRMSGAIRATARAGRWIRIMNNEKRKKKAPPPTPKRNSSASSIVVVVN